MRIPTTGDVLIDTAVAAAMFLLGTYLFVKKGSRFGLVVMAATLYWAWRIYETYAR